MPSRPAPWASFMSRRTSICTRCASRRSGEAPRTRRSRRSPRRSPAPSRRPMARPCAPSSRPAASSRRCCTRRSTRAGARRRSSSPSSTGRKGKDGPFVLALGPSRHLVFRRHGQWQRQCHHARGGAAPRRAPRRMAAGPAHLLLVGPFARALFGLGLVCGPEFRRARPALRRPCECRFDGRHRRRRAHRERRRRRARRPRQGSDARRDRPASRAAGAPRARATSPSGASASPPCTARSAISHPAR